MPAAGTSQTSETPAEDAATLRSPVTAGGRVGSPVGVVGAGAGAGVAERENVAIGERFEKPRAEPSVGVSKAVT